MSHGSNEKDEIYFPFVSRAKVQSSLLPSHYQLLFHLLKGRLMSFHPTNIAKIALELTNSLFELPNQVTGVDHSHNGIIKTDMNNPQ